MCVSFRLSNDTQCNTVKQGIVIIVEPGIVLFVVSFTSLMALQELLFPAMELGKLLLSLAYWDDGTKSLAFCTIFTYIIWR